MVRGEKISSKVKGMQCLHCEGKSIFGPLGEIKQHLASILGNSVSMPKHMEAVKAEAGHHKTTKKH